MISIRRANTSDTAWVARELRAFDAFFGGTYSWIPQQPGELERRVYEMLKAEHMYPWWVALLDGEPVGFIAGVLHPHHFNPEVVCLSEMFWWVTPAHRQSRAGWMLLSTFTLFGHGAANLIIMTLEAESPVKFGTLERLGYRVKETNFLLEVK